MKNSVGIYKRKGKSFKHIISKVGKEYCSTTTIHGINYLAADDKSVLEKVWWSIVFVLSVITCAYLIMQTWIKWQENPVIMSFSHKQTAVWEIPFPAITICPFTKVQNTMYNYTHAYLNRDKLTGESFQQFWDVSLICNVVHDIDPPNNITTNETIIDSIRKSAPDAAMTFHYMFWSGVHKDIEQIFFPLITEEGICFTFNSFSQEDMYTDIVKNTIIEHNKTNKGWNIETGYSPNVDKETYPEWTSQDGLFSGMNLKLRSFASDRDYKCGTPASGFKVILHNPADTPRISQQYILVPVKKQVAIAVTPNIVTTSPGLQNIPPQTRNCYFAHEKILRYFKVYTQNNCKIECIVNLTRNYCECLPFYFPRDNNTLICSFGDARCISMIPKLIYLYEMKTSIIQQHHKTELYKIYKQCNCLPSCASLEYSAETSHNDYHFIESIAEVILNRSFIDAGMEMTQLNIFFKSNQFMSLHRSELYGHTDFIANCGGLLGLCMGFSFFSLLEIVYFLTIRIWCYIKNKEERIIHVKE